MVTSHVSPVPSAEVDHNENKCEKVDEVKQSQPSHISPISRLIPKTESTNDKKCYSIDSIVSPAKSPTIDHFAFPESNSDETVTLKSNIKCSKKEFAKTNFHEIWKLNEDSVKKSNHNIDISNKYPLSKESQMSSALYTPPLHNDSLFRTDKVELKPKVSSTMNQNRKSSSITPQIKTEHVSESKTSGIEKERKLFKTNSTESPFSSSGQRSAFKSGGVNEKPDFSALFNAKQEELRLADSPTYRDYNEYMLLLAAKQNPSSL